MKKKFLVLILGIMMIIAIFTSSSFATSKKATTSSITEEQVQTMVDEKVQSAVSDAVNQIKTDTQSQSNSESNNESKENGLGMIAAAVATGLACIGSGIAVAVVASSAVGAISENSGLLGKTIIFAGLAEGIAIYGLIISIMILNKI